jgi:hypothetical protein
VQFDEATMRRLNRIIPSAKRQRTEFIRRAVKEAIRSPGVCPDASGVSPKA